MDHLSEDHINQGWQEYLPPEPPSRLARLARLTLGVVAITVLLGTFLRPAIAPRPAPYIAPPAPQAILDQFAEIALSQARSVYHVRAENREQGRYYVGTGFAIDERGSIVTNYHVVELGTSLFVIDFRGRRHSAEIVIFDKERDLALLSAATTTFPIMLGNYADIRPGDWLGFSGDLGEFGRYNGVGMVIEKNLIYEGQEYLVIGSVARSGTSGGPVYNQAGQAVGVVTSVVPDATFCVPVTHLMAFLARR